MLESRLVQSQNNEQESLLGSNIDRTLDRQHSPIMKDLTCQNASQSHMWDLHTQYSTLIPSTHCLNLTQTNENLNGEIVTREAEQHHRANPCDNIFRQMHIKCRRGDEKHGSKRTNETLWPVTDVPSAYNNTCLRASTALSHCLPQPGWGQS